MTAVAVFACGLLGSGCGSGEQVAADLVLTNGRLVTVDVSQPEAQALAAKGGRIVFVGSSAEAEAFVGAETEVVDLQGRLAIPGFIEGHGHFYGLGQSRLQLDLTATKNWDEIVAMVAESVQTTPTGQWILGRGWHQSKWDRLPSPSVDGSPVHNSLSAVSSEHPVLLTHASGHAAFVNAMALELAGIDQETAAPEGGEIVRTKNGSPTGLLRETAQALASRARDQAWDEQEARRIVEIAGRECLAKGITSFQDAGSPMEIVDLYRKMADEGSLPLRLWVMVRDSNQRMAERLSEVRTVGAGDHYLTVAGIKKSIDGALGAHGAWLLEPYDDMPSSSGLNTTDLEEITEAARLALEHDYQLCVHAIGDRANRETLDLFERSFLEAGVDGHERRWRIEHAQHLHPEDIGRFAQLGVVASMQGVHCTSDGPWVPDRLGDQRSLEGAYVWRKLLDSGAVVSNGTDTPVEDVDPLASFYASVSRQLGDGSVFYPDQRMTRMEALRSYTLDAAYAAFEEAIKGSLEVGKLADLVVLSKDILEVPEEQILEAEVRLTVVGGEVRYRGDGSVE